MPLVSRWANRHPVAATVSPDTQSACAGLGPIMYYIGDESYKMEVGPVRFSISIMARCLSRTSQDGVFDYLGLEAWIECQEGEWEFKPISHLNVSVI